MQARHYACLQGDPISAPTGLAPGSAPSPSLLNIILSEPLHKNGRMCAWFTGGTAAQQRNAALAFNMHQAQGDSTQEPLLSCPNSGDQYVPVQETAGGDVVKVVVHYRRNADCTHTFYNNQYSFVTKPNNLWLEDAQICDSTSSYCTNDVSAAPGCWNIPVVVNFHGVGLGDPDRKYWQTLDQYATTNNIGCSNFVPGTATFSVLT